MKGRKAEGKLVGGWLAKIKRRRHHKEDVSSAPPNSKVHTALGRSCCYNKPGYGPVTKARLSCWTNRQITQKVTLLSFVVVVFFVNVPIFYYSRKMLAKMGILTEVFTTCSVFLWRVASQFVQLCSGKGQTGDFWTLKADNRNWAKLTFSKKMSRRVQRAVPIPLHRDLICA